MGPLPSWPTWQPAPSHSLSLWLSPARMPLNPDPSSPLVCRAGPSLMHASCLVPPLSSLPCQPDPPLVAPSLYISPAHIGAIKKATSANLALFSLMRNPPHQRALPSEALSELTHVVLWLPEPPPLSDFEPPPRLVVSSVSRPPRLQFPSASPSRLNWRLGRARRWKGRPSVGKVGEWYVEHWCLQGCNPHLCRLRTDGFAPMSKY
jgi:hypothetical protein